MKQYTDEFAPFLNNDDAERDLLDTDTLDDGGVASLLFFTSAAAASSSLPSYASCGAGYFRDFSAGDIAGTCLACYPGSYSNVVAESVLHSCAGKCNDGYTSHYGSTSEDDCILAYKLMAVGSSSRSRRSSSGGDGVYSTSCSGAIDTTDDGWNNQGYEYITTLVECQRAARVLHADNVDVFDETATTVTERCADTNLLTGSPDFNTTLACKAIKLTQGRNSCRKPAEYENFNGARPISVDCSSTCSDCGQDARFCRPGTSPEKAPLGHCVLETVPGSSAGGAGHRLSFYNNCSANFYDGNDYAAVCKVVECNIESQIQGTGSKPIGPRTWPMSDQNAACELNAAQYARWARLEQDYYTFYFAINGGIAFLFYVFFFVYCCKQRNEKKVTKSRKSKRRAASLRVNKFTHERKGAIKNVDDALKLTFWESVQRFANPVYLKNLPPKQGTITFWTKCARVWDHLHSRQFRVVTYVVFKVSDLLSDWAFFIISISTNRFAFLMKREGFDAELFRWASLAFTILGSVLIYWDVKSLYARYIYKLRKEYHERGREYLKEQNLPFPLALKRPEKPKATWVTPLVVMVAEDVPQLILTVWYLKVVGFSRSDEVAIASLGLSCGGLLINMYLAFEPHLAKLLRGLQAGCMALLCRQSVSLFTPTNVNGIASFKPIYHHGKIDREEAQRRLNAAGRFQQARFLLRAASDGESTIISYIAGKITNPLYLDDDAASNSPWAVHSTVHPAVHLGVREHPPKSGNFQANGKTIEFGTWAKTDGKKMTLTDAINFKLRDIHMHLNKQLYPVKDTSLCFKQEGQKLLLKDLDNGAVELYSDVRNPSDAEYNYLQLSETTGHGQYLTLGGGNNGDDDEMYLAIQDLGSTGEYLDIDVSVELGEYLEINEQLQKFDQQIVSLLDDEPDDAGYMEVSNEDEIHHGVTATPAFAAAVLGFGGIDASAIYNDGPIYDRVQSRRSGWGMCCAQSDLVDDPNVVQEAKGFANARRKGPKLNTPDSTSAHASAAPPSLAATQNDIVMYDAEVVDDMQSRATKTNKVTKRVIQEAFMKSLEGLNEESSGANNEFSNVIGAIEMGINPHQPSNLETLNASATAGDKLHSIVHEFWSHQGIGDIDENMFAEKPRQLWNSALNRYDELKTGGEEGNGDDGGEFDGTISKLAASAVKGTKNPKKKGKKKKAGGKTKNKTQPKSPVEPDAAFFTGADLIADGEAEMAAAEMQPQPADAAFFAGPAAIEEAALAGGAQQAAVEGDLAVCSYSHFNKEAAALPGSTAESGQWEDCSLPATHGKYCSKHAAYEKHMHSSKHKKYLASFYSHKMRRVVDETIRETATTAHETTGREKQRWNPAQKKWVMLQDVPADCYFDFQYDNRYDQDEYV